MCVHVVCVCVNVICIVFRCVSPNERVGLNVSEGLRDMQTEELDKHSIPIKKNK
jgi:hypothetical protein